MQLVRQLKSTNMQKIKSIFNSETFILSFILILIAALVYLLFLPQFGYFNDDWYLMYAAGAKGAAAFKDIFIIDRPMRAFVMMPAYWLFGNDPVLYNLSAWGFRVLSALFFFWFLSALWNHQKKAAWLSALLFLIYPGFLSQFNGIDYQSQMVSLAIGMLTLVLTIYAYRSKNLSTRLLLLILLAALTTFYLGLVEYFVGIEALKFACIILLVFRDETAWLARIKKSALWAVCILLTSLPFLIWRLFFFQSERGATDVDVKFGDVLSNLSETLVTWASTFLKNIMDVSFGAWIIPLQKLTYGITIQQWAIGIIITILVLALVWLALKDQSLYKNSQIKFNWQIEAAWLGIVMLLSGLLPVILVGRYVDFTSFSRYALAPSIGVVLLWQAGLALISNLRIRNSLFTLLIISSTLTHYGNALTRARETEEMQNFWWQVSWRAPQIGEGTTLAVNYASVTIEEDYFVWGPAALIYYPESSHAEYPQPGVYAVVLTEEVINNIIERKPQDFSNRRSIRTYPNYRNILVITQPSLNSCAQIIAGTQTEYSSFEDKRIIQIGKYSEAAQIKTRESFQQPPFIPFGIEPAHDWCFYYQKASLARQIQNWEEVILLGNEARSLSYAAKDPIEWMPFLEAYARTGNIEDVTQIASQLDADAKQQACRILKSAPLSPAMLNLVNNILCIPN